MTYNRGCIHLGRAITSLVDLAVEINFLADTAKVISASHAFLPLTRVRTYSALMKTLRSTMVYSEDYEQFDAGFCLENVVTSLCDGERLTDCEVRMLSGKNGEPVWYNAQFLRADHTGEYNGRTVLILSDISHHKEVEARAARLSQLAERDPLTGLYNKKAASTLIDNFLRGEGKNARHTMIFCDLDDFKAVNDTYGHPFGDALLASICERLTQTFRREDILCRIGGDEFVVLMKNASGRSYVSHRADVLLERMSQPFTMGEHCVDVTMSLGIASYPECGTCYTELLQSADKAMYVSKFNGKNRYHFYSDLCADTRPAVPEAEAAETEGQHTPTRSRGKLSDYFFNLLYEATDINETMPLVLQLMGTHFNLGRVAITEFRNDMMHVIHQWNAAGVKELQKPIDYSGELRALFESSRSCENMAMRYNDIGQTPAQVRSKLAEAGIDDVYAFLHCPLLDNGSLRGYIVFFDCTSPRVWTEEERDILSYVSRLISLFVFKQQAYDRTAQALKILHHAVNGSPLAQIIVDRESFKLLYVCDRLRRTSGAKEGDICYKALYGSDSQCEFCPMKLLPEDADPDEVHTLERYFPDRREWFVYSASPLTLDDGSRACLCGKVDTTMYKTRELELEDENAALLARLAQLEGKNQ